MKWRTCVPALGFLAVISIPVQAQAQATSSAVFVGSDTTTIGNWHGTYGADGYSVANDSQSIPSYATFSLQNQAAWTWDQVPTDTRALQMGNGVGRIASTWYNSPSFSFDVNITDGNTHQLALYAIDWDNLGRAETIEVADAITSTVLDTRSVSSFSGGEYLQWNISGHVTISVSATSGPNAVISGVFFGGSSTITAAASFVRSDSATEGNWHGTYGADGYSVANDSQSIPSYATFSIQNEAGTTWAAETADVRALQTGDGVGRIAAAWYNSPSFSFDVNVVDGNTHQFALYALDWDSLGRAESVQVIDAGTEAVLDTQNINNFTNGLYLIWNISGHVKINLIGISGNAVASGVFFGGGSTVSSSSSFVRSDTTTLGNWHGTYGADGFSLAGDSQAIPSYSNFAIQNETSLTYSTQTADTRALQTVSGVGRIAAVWYNAPSFSFDVNFTDGNSHQLAVYAVDWDNLGRAESIQVIDAATSAVLDTRNISSFSNGIYLIWNISGHVKINVNTTAGPNSVVSGVFFGGSSTITSTASFVQSDGNTEGNWHGAYGADGYSVANDSQSIPSYATFAPQNEALWTWDPNPADSRALQTGSGVGRIAAAWYNSPSFSFDVNITDGNTHQLALYAIDWENSGRTETVQVLDAGTDALLDTENLSNFANGEYLVWNISGHVKISVIGTGGPNAVVSGAFFGGSSTITSTASFVKSDSTTEGTWHGTYGADGYSVASDSQSVPTYATFAIQNEDGFIWAASTSDTRALQMGSGSGRIAATWYNNPSFSFDSNFTDGNTHQFSLYAIDWDNSGRAETVQVLDAATEAVLDTRSISGFANGIYLVWNISGHIKINVIGSAGPTAVISGVFWDPKASSTGGNPVLQSIGITPSNPSITNGATQQFVATGTYSDGSTQDVSATAAWSSSIPNVATINSTGLATATGAGQSTIQATVGAVTGSTTLTVSTGASTGFASTGGLNSARISGTATLLTNGTVLFAGGRNLSAAALSSAEIYDPSTGTSSATGNLNVGRLAPTATLLNDGTVLVAGGSGNANFASAEVYNPATQSFTEVGNMSTGRYTQTATLLNSGKVLIAGGVDSNGNISATADIYDPATASFTPTGSLMSARADHTATLLNDGTVLIVGGNDNSGNVITAEIYNPTAGTFTTVSNPITARSSHTATLLNNGMVLIAGGYDNNGNVISTAELYNPATTTFISTGSPNTARAGYSVTLLNNGTALFVEGFGTDFNDVTSAELYDPSTGTFTYANSGTLARDSQTATLLLNGNVLVAGGEDNSLNPLTTAELYTPGTLVPSGLVSITVNPFNPIEFVATSQRFTATGTFSDNSTQTLASATWSSSNNTIATITNDSTNQGNGFGITAGAVAVSACTGTICGSTLLTVNTSTLTSIAIGPSNQVILIGSSIQLRAIGRFSDGGTEDLSSSVTWSSSQLLVATINSVGSASGFTKGTTTITATLAGVTGSTSLTVTPTLISIAISPQNAYVAQGATQQFSAMGSYSDASTADITSTVSWSSSDNTVVSINSSGLATGVAQGSATIAASSGSVSSSVTVNVKAALVSIAISPSSSSLPLGLAEPLTASGSFADNTAVDLTSSVNWSSSSASVATVSATGIVTPVTQGTTSITATFEGVSGTASLMVSAPTVLTVAVSPQNPAVPVGTNLQFTLTGKFSDGTTADVTSSASWASSNSNVASVNGSGLASATSSGTTVITAMINGFVLPANLVVTASGPPTITAIVSPTPNAAGWNNTNVTVTFTCAPGSSLVTSCPSAQTITSEGAGQIVSGTVTDAVGATATTSVTLNVDKTPPTLTLISPTDGNVISVGSIAANGTVTDALSGVSSLTCNGSPVSFSGGGFSCNISLNSGVNLVVVRATDAAGNVALAKLHVTCSLPLPIPNSLQITPSIVNLVIGDTQQFTVIDEQGRPRPDATWSVSDPTVASMTSDAQPTLTGLASGLVTLTATVQGISTQVQPSILNGPLAPGAPSWSTQPLIGYAPDGAIPAVPSADGPGLYSLESATSNNTIRVVRALTSDGQARWQDSPVVQSAPVPDLFGGAILNSNSQTSNALVDADGQTGSAVWQYPSQNTFSDVAIRPDGAILALESDPQGHPLSLDLFDGNTGQQTLRYTLPQGTATGTNQVTCAPNQNTMGTSPDSVAVSRITVGFDGTAYMEYMIDNKTQNSLADCSAGITTFTTVDDTTTSLLTLSIDGSISQQVLKSDEALQSGSNGAQFDNFTIPSTCFASGSFTFPNQVIPDGQGGALAAWFEDKGNVCSANNPPALSMVSDSSPQGGSTYSLPLQNALQFVLGEGGVAFAEDSRNVISFDLNSGQVFWIYEAPSIYQVSLMAATGDGGLTIAGYQSLLSGGTGNTDIIQLNNQGTSSLISSITASVPPISSWWEKWYLGETEITLPVEADSASPWATPGGNPSQNNWGVPICPCEWQSTNTTTSDFAPLLKRMDRLARARFQHVQLVSYSRSLFGFAPHNSSLFRFASPFPQVGGANLTYVLLVGDPGLNGENCAITGQACHNVGQLFNLAASTQANSLTASGNNIVVSKRVSSVQDFEAGLTKNGNITGGVYYFGHAAQSDNYTVSLLAPGQTPGVDTNISQFNYQQLTNPELASGATIILDACNAGLRPLNGSGHSIAQLLANQLGTIVKAWKIGLFFGATPNAPAPRYKDPTMDPAYKQNGTIYMLPWNSAAPCTFVPNQAEPQHCGGMR